ncbi:hypothetical protein ABIC83_002828 [Roseateles asaccharophilus]|uniref:hypothetical protein n=1 Tax=Roseateles asaccharophilus TaxID=582607 RepID=UPI0038393FB3
MQIKVSTTNAELKEMGLTADQLQDSITECLDRNARAPDGNEMDYSGFVVEVEVLPTPAEFGQSLDAAVTR